MHLLPKQFATHIARHAAVSSHSSRSPSTTGKLAPSDKHAPGAAPLVWSVAHRATSAPQADRPIGAPATRGGRRAPRARAWLPPVAHGRLRWWRMRGGGQEGSWPPARWHSHHDAMRAVRRGAAQGRRARSSRARPSVRSDEIIETDPSGTWPHACESLSRQCDLLPETARGLPSTRGPPPLEGEGGDPTRRERHTTETEPAARPRRS